MEDIIFNNEKDIDGFFGHLKSLGSGAEGVVYKKRIIHIRDIMIYIEIYIVMRYLFIDYLDIEI